jgi:hypothetical protein
MARDGSGTYTRVSNSFTAPISGTPISPTDADAFWDELDAEITDSLSRSGKGGMSADLDMNNNDINEIKTAVFQGSTSGNTTLIATAIAGTTTLMLPAATDTLVTQTQLDAKAAGAASSTDNAAARYDSTTGKIIQNSALIIADTTGAISRAGGGGIPIQGSNTNSTTAAGDVGQLLEDIDNNVSLTTATATNISSISLTAGNWLIFGGVLFTGTGTTQATELWASINTVTATNVFTQGQCVRLRGSTYTDPLLGFPLGPLPVSLSGTTTYYLNAQANFTVSTLTCSGKIYAIRLP